jgi:hypothetical protein
VQHIAAFEETDDLAVHELIHLIAVFSFDQEAFAFEAGGHEAAFGYALMERHGEFLFVEASWRRGRSRSSRASGLDLSYR